MYDSGKERKVRHSMDRKFVGPMMICGIEFLDLEINMENVCVVQAFSGPDRPQRNMNNIPDFLTISHMKVSMKDGKK